VAAGGCPRGTELTAGNENPYSRPHSASKVNSSVAVSRRELIGSSAGDDIRDRMNQTQAMPANVKAAPARPLNLYPAKEVAIAAITTKHAPMEKRKTR
tara:strand:+ start:640 stop:933 length:294 start_codon:yes stop_codon:yes gene_type:complete